MATTITVKDASGDNQVLPVPTAHAEEATLTQISSRVNTTNSKLDTLDAAVDAVKDSVDSADAKLGTSNTRLNEIKTSTDAVGAGVARLRAPGGTEIVSDTAAHNGLDAHTLVVLSETAEIDVLTASDVSGATGIELPRGTVLVSEAGITAVTLASGTVALYLNA